MKIIKKACFQGDVMFRRVRAVPSGVPEQVVKGPIVCAHSETGHDHRIDATDGVRLFQDPKDPLVCYLQLDGVEYADVVHHRDFHTHETVRLLGTPKRKSTFQVRRQREWTPEGWRRAAD